MKSFVDSPARNLIGGLIFMVVIITCATLAFTAEGWSFSDSFYFVIITVFTVGYDEVHPLLTPELRSITLATIILGCTGMIFLTGALVQFITFGQIQQLLGNRRMKTQIGRMRGHVIVCGYGRIGQMLAEELKAGNIEFLILDREEAKLSEAAARGHATLLGDATDETVLQTARVEHARALACVVPNDAVNVFITLSARNLNKDIEIIARGEAASTKSKLLRAGASAVVEPTHIGAERIAQLILFPRSVKLTDSSHMRMLGTGLRTLGLELESQSVAMDSPYAGQSVEAIEHGAGGTLFVVALNRRDGTTITRPGPELVVEAGDGVVIITRAGRETPQHGPAHGWPPRLA
ncbi:potassium channel family protein [Acidocella sp.]|uniref:potassium channel family protein n=1 Tax=Acidocella sp. TaxID=50710 RepID=UPI003D00BF29